MSKLQIGVNCQNNRAPDMFEYSSKPGLLKDEGPGRKNQSF